MIKGYPRLLKITLDNERTKGYTRFLKDILDC